MPRTPSPIPVKTVQCYHCARWIEVAQRAQTLTCPVCYGRLRVDDVVIVDETSTSEVRTCGRILVARRARLRAGVVEARLGVEVLGSLQGKVVSGSTVRIGPRAVWEGDCHAPAIELHPTAVIVGGRFCITPLSAPGKAAS